MLALGEFGKATFDDSDEENLDERGMTIVKVNYLTYSLKTASAAQVEERTVSDIIEELKKKTPFGHEHLSGKVIPYYDFDKSGAYETEAEYEVEREECLEKAYSRIKARYPAGRIFTFDASGWSDVKECWRISFHFIVRGVGYFSTPSAVKRAGLPDGFDPNPYSSDKQKFRMPYHYNDSWKDGKLTGERPLLRIIYPRPPSKGWADNGKIETYHEVAAVCGETFEDWLIQNVRGEKKCLDVAYQIRKPSPVRADNLTAGVTAGTSAVKKMLIMGDESDSESDGDDEKEADNGEDGGSVAGDPQNREYDEDDVRDLVKIIKYQDFNHETAYWKSLVLSIGGFAHENNYDMSDLAQEVSKSAHNYDESATDYLYGRARGERGVGTLITMAKQDNPVKFRQWAAAWKEKHIGQRKSAVTPEEILANSGKDDDDVAVYFLSVWGDDINIEFAGKNHYSVHNWDGQFWVKGHTNIIECMIGKEMYNRFKKWIGDYNFPTPEQYSECTKLLKRFRNCRTRAGYIKSIVNAVTRSSKQIEFDANPNLLAFTNGVYDLEAGVFRDGRKEDYLSQVVPYDWRESTDAEEAKMMDFINKVMPLEDERDVLLKALATGISGQMIENVFILTGNGRNGKDTLVTNLLKAALGDDLYLPNAVSLLTERQKAGISQEKANMHNKRCVVYSEPDSGVPLITATLKEFTGCPTLCGRGLYSETTVINNKATTIIHANKIPHLSHTDQAIARRLIIIPFRAQFLTDDELSKYDSEELYIYKVDPYYKSRAFLMESRLPFMNLLIKYFAKFTADGSKITGLTKKMTNHAARYMRDSSDFMCWFDDNFKHTGRKEDLVKVKDIYALYKASEYYTNLSKREKRKHTSKYILSEIETNPALRQFFRGRIKVSGKQYKSVIYGHVERPEELSESESDEDDSSDDEANPFSEKK
jgi:phage/plasmid-associated DNA primase